MGEESFLGEVAGDITGVAETGLHAAEGIYDGATGNWDGAADSALSMTEGALGVATGGIFTAGEELADQGLHAAGLPSAHDLINSGAQEVGGFLGDALHSAVGDEAALKSVQDFDNGDILGGLGDMAGGMAHNAGNLIDEGVNYLEQNGGSLLESAESAIGNLF
ncbi:MAG TPA: hypothetical protein VIJ23_01515 [Mycobacterium sp.]